MRALLLLALPLLALAACASPAPPPHSAPPAATPVVARDAVADVAIAIDAPLADGPPPDAPPPDATSPDAAVAAATPLKRATIGAHGCPTTFDANALECSKVQQVCTYPQGGCICMPSCAGGAAPRPLGPGEKPPVPHWECYPMPKRTDGCPATLPHGACKGALECSYGRIDSGMCWGAKVRCVHGEWMAVQVPPPP